ncbi:phosphoglycolate phosphatase [Methanococcoides methylutens]|uniref:Phosphoglycolate phosphatase n=1 Tax=Methanococcoides methylutens MM1 TaxID=1434104 RepID=A0A0E3SP19_METMT|nr:phosphoglycolate phosphatase [Methanococcoides methylutens]AKB84306.1 Phosphoglycolate phosphatase, archaeal type [Methanococcoides methylutens MM1]
MVFKALVVDIDGTITNPDRSLDLRVAKRFRELRVPVVLSTGNPLCYVHAAAKLIGLGGIVIAENGGVISTGFDKPSIIADGMEKCEEAYELLSNYFDLEKLDAAYRKTEVVLRRGMDISQLREIVEDNGMEVEIIDTGYAVHIKDGKINKGTGLHTVAELMGIDTKDFLAIGDSCNDAEMMREAGLGIAVGNADDDARKAASMVTKASFGEGMLEAIEYAFSNGLLE